MQQDIDRSFRPLVSIIIPVYNGADYLDQAIESALNQSYTPLEILVINDGSYDEGATERLALGYGDRIRYFSKPNGRVASALNFGIREMRGEYFSWLSHDDLYHPDKIRLQVEALSRLQNKDTILYSGYKLIDAAGKPKGVVAPQQDYSLSQLETPLFAVMRGLVNGCTLLISKALFDRVGLFREDLRSTQDYDLWDRMFRQTPVHFMSESLVQTRLHANQGIFTVSTHNEECSQLWQRLISGVTVEEAEAMDGSYAAFLIKSQRFLAPTPYSQAYEAVCAMVTKALAPIKVSVIIPFYNRVQQTLEAIASVRCQSHANLEIIVVNDGSTDDITAILQVLEEDERIRYVALANSGPAAARNAALAIAQGEYIAFLDSDDVFLPTKVSKQLAHMQAEHSVFSHTSYSIKKAGEDDLTLSDAQHFSGNVYPDIIRMCPIATPTVMVSRTYLGARRFKEEYRIGEDVCMWIDLAKDTSLGAVAEPLTVVNICEHSSSQQYEHLLRSALHVGVHVHNSAAHRAYSRYVTDLLHDVTSVVVGCQKRWHKDMYYFLKLYYAEAFFKTLVYQGPRVTLKKIFKRIGFFSS